MALSISEDDVPPILDNDTTDNATDAPYTSGSRICKTCGLPIPDELSGGGRRKYHEECRPVQGTVKATGKGGRSTNIDTLIQQIADLYRNVGIGLAFFPSMSMDGMVVADQAAKLAESWRPLIEKDPKIRKAWERITTGSGWGTVVMAHAGIGMVIAYNHGLTLPGMPNQHVEVSSDE